MLHMDTNEHCEMNLKLLGISCLPVVSCGEDMTLEGGCLSWRPVVSSYPATLPSLTCSSVGDSVTFDQQLSIIPFPQP